MLPVLTVPGFGNSEPGHWHEHWENKELSAKRVNFGEWRKPELGQWMRRLDQAVKDTGQPTLLAAHSLGALTVAHWAAGGGRGCVGALLVAVPDPKGSIFPDARGFFPIPDCPMPFPCIVVASTNDPYLSAPRAEKLANAWGARFECIGPVGHINHQSGLGRWALGLKYMKALQQAAECQFSELAAAPRHR